VGQNHPRTGGYEGASAGGANATGPAHDQGETAWREFPCRPLLDRRDGALRFAAFHDEPVFEAVPRPLDSRGGRRIMLMQAIIADQLPSVTPNTTSLFRCSSSSTNTWVISVLKPSL
jgi:hypothetical protein